MSCYILMAVVILTMSVVLFYAQNMLKPKLLPIVEGFFQPEFMSVAQTIRRNMESGIEQGAAFVVFYDGEPVIDMWAGYADQQSYRRWRNETTTLTFGCTAGVQAILVNIMVQNGLLNYSQPISEYWPEFQKNGKENITLKMLLDHKAGLPYLDESVSLRDLVSPFKQIETLIVNQVPVWPPGSVFGYHEHTVALILDRLVSKVDPKHRDIDEIFSEEIAVPFGIEFDVHLKRRDVHKTARIHEQSLLQRLCHYMKNPSYLIMYLTSIFGSRSPHHRSTGTLHENSMPDTVYNDPELREVTLSSLTGTGTARGLAKLYSLMDANLHEALFDSTSDYHSVCNITGLPMNFNLGFQIFKNPYGEPIFGNAGYGGQIVVTDPVHKLSMSYLTSYLSIYRNGDDPKFLELQSIVYNSLHKYLNRRNKS